MKSQGAGAPCIFLSVIIMKSTSTFVTLLLIGLSTSAAHAQDVTAEIVELRHFLMEMQQDYEQRITDLEERLTRAERLAGGARRDADEAIDLAEQTAIDLSTGTSAPNTFNPSIGAVLNGGYANVDAGWVAIPGFQPAGEIGTGSSGFSPGEAEINLKANVDSRYFGNLTLGFGEDDGDVELEIEEAWVQTTNLPSGLSLMVGRFFSAAGYLNSFHFHADDFVDRPLPYQAFFGGRYKIDGVAARWIAPTSLLFEIGAEANWGGGFPATASDQSSPGAWTLFANVGGDIGTSQSWQLGLSQVNADAIERNGAAEDAAVAAATFTGSSDLSTLDFVWKWAPQGNANIRNVKVQGEYFRREENGVFGTLPYDGEQTGWYLQGVWQFAPFWRVGLRHDLVDSDNGSGLVGTGLEDPGRNSRRNSLMLDWSPSEFSRLRLQYTRDDVLPVTEDQWYLQYIMSIGAHGSHQF